MKLIYLKSPLKRDSFDVTIGIEITFFRVSVTIEPGRSLLEFVTTNCLIFHIDKWFIWSLAANKTVSTTNSKKYFRFIFQLSSIENHV